MALLLLERSTMAKKSLKSKKEPLLSLDIEEGNVSNKSKSKTGRCASMLLLMMTKAVAGLVA